MRPVAATDEHLHELGPEPSFNESMYANFFDPVGGLGGFLRLANRANEGTGEMTVCLFLPEGPVGFMFHRPAVTSNEVLDAGGLRFTVVEPFEHLEVAYHGPLLLLDDPKALADPKAAFRTHPTVACRLELALRAVAPAVGGEAEEPEAPGQEFARGHYEVLVAAEGTVSVAETETAVAGFGLRDHSWGPRSWQAPWYYRWLTGNAGGDLGFMATEIVRRDGTRVEGGFLFDDGALERFSRCSIETTWEGPEHHHRVVRAELSSSKRRFVVEGQVRQVVPLRNRRPDASGAMAVTRLLEGLTEWHLLDGRRGLGLAEYLDQLVDGRPAGLG